MTDILSQWIVRSPLPTGQRLNAICRGNGLFVAVGDKGTIITSSDGQNWTQLDPSTDHDLRGVGFASYNGMTRFVAVGDAGAILISDDGNQWAPQFTGIPKYLRAITCDDNRRICVAVGDQNTILTSADGVTWADRPCSGLPIQVPLGFRSVCHLFGITDKAALVAVGDQGAVATSEDGLSWKFEGIQTFQNENLNAVYPDLFGDFIAVGDHGVVLHSPDGYNWGHNNSGTAANLSGVCTWNGKIVIVGSGPRVGIWENSVFVPKLPAGANGLHAVCGGDAPLSCVAVGEGGAVWSSPDGDAWYAHYSGNSEYIRDLAFGNNTFVSILENSDAVLTSSNGIDWYPQAFLNNNQLNKLCFGVGRFVVVGENGTIFNTTNGIRWSKKISGVNESLSGVCFGKGKFVVVGGHYTGGGEIDPVDPLSGTCVILTSPNGVTWSALYSPSNPHTPLTAVCCGDSRFVALGFNGMTMSSTDGVTWQVDNQGVFSNLNAVCFGKGIYVAVGPSGAILTSTDGVLWTPANSGTTQNLYRVAYGNGIFVAVGDQGTLLTSSEGYSWKERDLYRNNDLWGVIFGFDTFVAAGSGRTIVQSVNLPLPAIPSITTNKTSPQKMGTAVRWTCHATGLPDLLYYFRLNKAGVNSRPEPTWRIHFSPQNDCEFILQTPGAYSVTVTVKDPYGNTVSKTSDPFTISIKM